MALGGPSLFALSALSCGPSWSTSTTASVSSVQVQQISVGPDVPRGPAALDLPADPHDNEVLRRRLDHPVYLAHSVRPLCQVLPLFRRISLI